MRVALLKNLRLPDDEAEFEPTTRDATREAVASDDGPTVQRGAAEVCGGCLQLFGTSETRDQLRMRSGGAMISLHKGSIECGLKAIKVRAGIKMTRDDAKRLIARFLDLVRA